MSIYSVLAGRIQEAMSDLERVVGRAEELLGKAQRHSDDGYLDIIGYKLILSFSAPFCVALIKSNHDAEGWRFRCSPS